MTSPPPRRHSLYQQVSDANLEIQLAREDMYDACEKSHLLSDDINPSFAKDCQVAVSSYKYAKDNQSAPFYKEILRALGIFQKRVNNSRIQIENISKKSNLNTSFCCSACDNNIQISLVLLGEYFRKDTVSDSLHDNACTLPQIPDSLSSSYSSSSNSV